MRIVSAIATSISLIVIGTLVPCSDLGCETLSAASPPVRASKPASAELRAVRFLSKEVPGWKPKNKCYSCHNNGDAARGLFVARQLRFPVPREALKDTSRWLRSPDRWAAGGGDEPFKDKKLAHMQFTFALAEGVAAGTIADKKPLAGALDTLVAEQQPDGSWKVGGDGIVGSPTTYGRTLATVLAHRALTRFDRRKYAAAVGKAERWMQSRQPQSVLDAAALLWGLSQWKDPAPKPLETHCRKIIFRGQSRDGGWGPFVTSASEPFDTAIVLLALAGRQQDPAVARAVRRGRAYLVHEQFSDGGWNETTRPSGRESYAQRISTTGWALLALLATR